MHLTIQWMLHAASPKLADKFEHDHANDPAAAPGRHLEPATLGSPTTDRTDD